MVSVSMEAKELLYRESRLNRVIVLDDLDYTWDREDLKKIKHMREKGLPINDIVYEFNRNPDETLIALIHLATNDDEKFRQRYVITCENLDFLWEWSELRELVTIWNMGLSIRYAAEYFERDKGDILLGIMHLARINKIKRRRGGLF
jgi:hypothetical protein